ncbi:helix-turn-helix domain-containing protein [Trinickia mobilis]|uniref:helix-turn-helix domain-containing protein n=1 Tax=Trinickia mobilis TaxID=2816356 RepID=UPI001A8C1AAA|nr:helix-turn-helix transcriptional regulator [Trinickia mobilis]
MKSHNRSFGKILRKLRKDRQLSQEALSYEAGLDRSYISLLELGRRSPTLDSLVALSRALGVTLTEIVSAIETDNE